MAVCLQSSLVCLTCRPKLKLKSQHVRAQALGDEGSSNNMVDANMSTLKERIESIRRRERLQRCYRSVQQHGWNYNHTTLKKQANLPESLQLMLMCCKTFGLTVAVSSLLLCIFSIVVHCRLLGD